MRRLLILIGLFVPQAALAASQVCSLLMPGAVSSPAIAPVNPDYVLTVLDRINTGINTAQQSPSASGFEQYAPDWLKQVDDAARRLLDTKLLVTEQQRDLENFSACLHIDRILLQCANDRVIQEMHAAMQNGSWGAILRLIELLPFVQDRELQLVTGGNDPHYRDRGWHTRQDFDPADSPYGKIPQEGDTQDAVCGDGFIVAPEECDGGPGCNDQCMSMFCPFSSDYSEPSTSGFGCDAETMAGGGRPMFEPLRIEMEQEQFIEDMLRAAQERAAALASLENSVNPTAGGITYAVRSHQTARGCYDTRGFCEGDSSIGCFENATCRSANAGNCIITDLQGISLTPERHAFSIERDNWRVINGFERLRRKQGLARVQRSDLQEQWYQEGATPSLGEIPEVQQRRSYYQEVSGNQGAAEARGFVLGAEPQLVVLTGLKELQKAIAELAEFAAGRQGLRAAITRFAYFLLRTCMDRPCSLRLERIVKIAMTDECFPYTNGIFLQSSCDNPSWQICRDAIQDTESQYSPDPGFVEFDPQYPDPTCEGQ